MDSFNHSHRQTTSFRYNPNSNTMHHADDDAEFSGILEVYVHHARNIHNICIYDNQDVYAKFSLTYNPDETLSTRIINGGGKNPIFNENLRIKVTQMDAVLKCEIWMFSRSRIHLEDQLLGFALVQISQVVGKGKVTQDYSLSSTDLFHSPVGTVQLTLSLESSFPLSSTLSPLSQSTAATNSSISSEVVLLDPKNSQDMSDPVEYSRRIEFPDINVMKENQKMVSEYFNLETCVSSASSRPGNSSGPLPFLHLGASPQLGDDYEMAVTSPNESIQNSVFPTSTTTSLSDDRNSADSVEKKSNLGGESSNCFNVEGGSKNSGTSPDTPTSKKESKAMHDNSKEYSKFSSSKEKEINVDNRNMEAVAKFGEAFSAPLGNINNEAEQSAMQKQIVDMYMRSMQQFTESLAKMKLPMDLDKPEAESEEGHGDVIQSHNNKSKLEIDKMKKDGSRVFYGSRAFF
ncbi:hypothetical protein RJT34_00281 [Clitoria ternatea]|uniref:C2 domain-containing protein n=1 Tax=Clitoria ternatea TaxID=43366 RepID=A0AAN9KJ17_CLITE